MEDLKKFTKEQLQYVDIRVCPFCGKKIYSAADFRDELSIKEFQISGLCQDCQDEIWGK